MISLFRFCPAAIIIKYDELKFLEENRATFRALSHRGQLVLEDIEQPLTILLDPARKGTAELVYGESGKLLGVPLVR